MTNGTGITTEGTCVKKWPECRRRIKEIFSEKCTNIVISDTGIISVRKKPEKRIPLKIMNLKNNFLKQFKKMRTVTCISVSGKR